MNSKSFPALPLLICLVAAIGAPGCQRGKDGATGGKGEVVAKVGKGVITSEEVSAKLKEQSPLIVARYATLERKKEFVDGLVRFEILAQEAERQGLDKDPEVRSTLRKIMVQKLLHDAYEKASQPVPEAELKNYYQEHLIEFVKPERVRASLIFLAAPKGNAKRDPVSKEAAKLLVEIRGKESGPVKTEFAAAAQKRSDDPATRALGGDLNFKTREELAQVWGQPVADAAFNLKAMNDMSPVVATDKGFHLLKLTARQVGMNQPFEVARTRIESRLTSERRSKAVDGFVTDLRAKTPVTIDDGALSRIQISPAAPSFQGVHSTQPDK